MYRPSRRVVNLRVAKEYSRRSTCKRAQVGCVVTQDNRLVATGYNGALPGDSHCDDATCNALNPCPNSIHAEANLISFAARNGVPLKGGVLYCTHSPCKNCTQLIIQAGIVEIFYVYEYRSTPFELLEKHDIRITKVHEDVIQDNYYTERS